MSIDPYKLGQQRAYFRNGGRTGWPKCSRCKERPVAGSPYAMLCADCRRATRKVQSEIMARFWALKNSKQSTKKE